jgi:hypothetical protein
MPQAAFFAGCCKVRHESDRQNLKSRKWLNLLPVRPLAGLWAVCFAGFYGFLPYDIQVFISHIILFFWLLRQLNSIGVILRSALVGRVVFRCLGLLGINTSF